MHSPELSEEVVTTNSFRYIEDFRRWLILRPQYLEALSNSLFHGENLKRLDKSIRFRYKNNLYDIIDEFISEDIQFFTIRKRGVDIQVEPIDFDYAEEEVHIRAVKPTKLLDPAIVYFNVSNKKKFEKNSMQAISGVIRMLTALR